MKTNNATPADMNQTIYNEIAKHAARAFKFVDIQPGKYNAAQISKALDKKTAKYDERAAAGALEEVVTVAVGSFECKFELGGAFNVLEKIAKYWEITPAARAIFVREKEDAAPVAAFDVTPAAATVCRAINKKDSRENMRYICIDAARRAVVGSDGGILTAAALPSLTTDDEHATAKFLIDPKLIKAGRVVIDAKGNAANGANVAPLCSLNYPNWAPCFEKVFDTDAVTFDKKTAAALKKAVASAAKFSDVTPDGWGRDLRTVVIYGEMYTDKITVRARHTETVRKDNKLEDVTIYRDYNVTMPATLQRSFLFAMNGTRFAQLPAFDTIYFPENFTRALTVAGKNAVSILMPVKIEDDWQHPTAATYEYKRPNCAKEINTLDILNVTPAPVALNATDDQEGSTPAAVADCQEDATPAPMDETTAAADIDATPADCQEDAADVITDDQEGSTTAAADIDATPAPVAAQKAIICEVLAIHRILPGLILQHKHDKNLYVVILGTTKRGYKTKEIYFYPDSRKRAKVTTKYYFSLEIEPGGKSLFDICPVSNIAAVLAVLDKDTLKIAAPVANESESTPAAADIDATNESTPAADCQEDATPAHIAAMDETPAADVITDDQEGTDDQTDNATPAAADIESTPAAVVADIESTDDQEDNATPARVAWLQYFARVAAAVVLIILAFAGRNIDNATPAGPSLANIGVLKHATATKATPATDNATPAAKTAHGANKAAKIESNAAPAAADIESTGDQEGTTNESTILKHATVTKARPAADNATPAAVVADIESTDDQEDNATPAAADIESTPAADCQEDTDESDAADVITDDQTDNATPAAVAADIESTDDQTDNASDENTGDQEGSTPAESTTSGTAPTATPTATPAPAVFGLSPAAGVFSPIL